MAEVTGTLVNLWLRVSGTLNAFKKVICVEDSQFDITSESNTRRTNCGLKTSITDPEFTASVNAVQDPNPTSTQLAYNDLKAWMKSKTKLDFNYKNDVDAPNGLDEGEGIANWGSCYLTSLGAAASADADGLLTYSVEITGTGSLDNYDGNATS